MSGALGQQFPNRQTAWVDPKTGVMNPVSHALLHSLWQRTGGGTAQATSTQMQAEIATNTTAIAANTTAIAAIPSVYAPLASPHLTGAPTVPTATSGTATTQVASTAFVAAGFMPLGTQLSAALVADVALANVGLFYTGPTVAQGTAGTWFASGSVVLVDAAVGATFNVKLWDGVTVIASGVVASAALGSVVQISLSGILTGPAGNIRISVQDATAATGKIAFNQSGLSKDSILTVFRVA